MGTVVVLAMGVAAIVFLHPADQDLDAGDLVARGVWHPMAASDLAGRSSPSVVWTRKAMIVWGGTGDTGVLGDGASYDLSSDTWTLLPPAPLSPRTGHTAVWTGDRMLVWGGSGVREGCEGLCPLADGAAYDPGSKTWTPLAPAPIGPRSGHTAVFVQNRMVVWGGAGEGGAALADGASFDAEANSWTVLPPAPVGPRVSHRAAATTDRMLLWGGSSEAVEGGLYLDDGAVYNTLTGAWALMAAGPASLAARDTFAGVWTGRQLLVWGGYGRSDACTPCLRADGAAYDPDTDSWTPMAPSPLSGRGGQRAVWTGRDMLVWGGFDTAVEGDGALYNPVDDSWVLLPPVPLHPRQLHAMVWTGRQLLVWGGAGADGRLADGAVLTLDAA